MSNSHVVRGSEFVMPLPVIAESFFTTTTDMEYNKRDNDLIRMYHLQID
jgi:hypothetical protein